MLLLTAATPAAVTFGGITLGETTQQLLAQRGDPLQVFDRPNDLEYAYLSPADNALIFATIERGRVVAVEGVTIPPESEREPRFGALGLHLHDDASAVEKLGTPMQVSTGERDGADGKGPFRGSDGLNYYFSAGNIITGITAQLPLAQRSALAANDVKPVIHQGLTLDDAIVVQATTETIGIETEHSYLSYHGCTFFFGAHVTHQALLTHNGKQYDRLTLSGCRGDGNRDYYFDITSFYGKL